jgi:hypothetical protein
MMLGGLFVWLGGVSMYSNKKSLATSMVVLYLLLAVYEFWCIDDLNKQLDDVEAQMTELEREMNDLEVELDEIGDRYDNLNNCFALLDERVSALEVMAEDMKKIESTEDTEEQIQDEITEGEIEILAQLIEAEAGNQDFIGKCLVADVILNRVDSDIFPDTIEDVIMERHYRKRDGVWCYQFSTVKYGSFEKAGWNISADSLAAARQEYESERIDADILYFTAGSYNDYCVPAYVHGDHYFGY